MRASTAGRHRILHLAYEDPNAPESGGGAVRTEEVYRRLEGFEVEVLTYSYPGAQRRSRNGVKWKHVGFGARNKLLSIASYYASLPAVILSKSYDLLVEDFAPPFTYAFSPLFAKTPVVAVVQWLFAREMADKYRVPLACLEGLGLQLYNSFIVMTDTMRSELLNRAPNSDICVAGCAVDESLFETVPRDDGYALFLGRLDVHQKGLDILLRRAAALPDLDFRLRIAGDGKDEGRLRQLVADLGLTERVKFLGRVSGPDKADALAGCRLLCMPSRYETFGIVAAEAMACGKPVLATDIPALRELIPARTGVLVPPLDERAFGHELARLWRDPALCRRLGAEARDKLQRLTWDHIAERQAAFYRHVLRERAPQTFHRKRPAND